MRRGSVIQLVVMGVVFTALASAVAVFIPWLPESAGKESDRIHWVIWFTTWISVAIFALVATVLTYSIVKFRARPDDDSDGLPIHGHTGLEIVWTAVPAILVTSISIVSGVVLARNGDAGTKPFTIKVTAVQFAWTFTYGNGVTLGRLYLPEGRKTRLEITSKDVIHSFWVPQLSQKQDAVPGQTNKLVVTPKVTGRERTFPVVCTELCGLGHAIMRASATIMPAAKFDAWLAQQGGGGGPGAAPAGNAAGLEVFNANSCGGCHTFKAAGATATVGPDLDRLPELAKQAGKPLETFIKESIVNPQAYTEKGYPKAGMPAIFKDTIKPDQLDALVQYLASGGK